MANPISTWVEPFDYPDGTPLHSIPTLRNQEYDGVGTTAGVYGGRLEGRNQATDATGFYFESQNAYDPRGSEIFFYMDISTMPDLGVDYYDLYHYNFIEIALLPTGGWSGPGDFAEIVIHPYALQVQIGMEGDYWYEVQSRDDAEDPPMDFWKWKWWKFRVSADGATVWVEASVDGRVWEVLHTNTGLDMQNVHFMFRNYGWTFGDTLPPWTLVLDHINVPPPERIVVEQSRCDPLVVIDYSGSEFPPETLWTLERATYVPGLPPANQPWIPLATGVTLPYAWSRPEIMAPLTYLFRGSPDT